MRFSARRPRDLTVSHSSSTNQFVVAVNALFLRDHTPQRAPEGRLLPNAVANCPHSSRCADVGTLPAVPVMNAFGMYSRPRRLGWLDEAEYVRPGASSVGSEGGVCVARRL